MKKNMIALAVAAAFAAPVAMADAPVVYGKINVNVNATSGKDASVNSTASRLGIKGSEDLGNGLKAVYKVEFGVNVADQDYTSKTVKDDTTKRTLSNRNSYLGVAGGFGTVLLGRHDTPLKMSQPSDLFNDGAADLGNVNMDAGIEVGEDRANDVLAYVSPSFSGVKIIAAAVMGADKDATSYDDATSVALTYGSTKKGLYLAAAQTASKDSSGDSYAITRLSAQYKANGLTVNAIHSDNSGALDGTVIQFNAGYKIGKFMPKVKVSSTDDGAGTKTSNTAIGLNYSLGKKTTAYIYTVDADKKNSSGKDATILGMVHKF